MFEDYFVGIVDRLQDLAFYMVSAAAIGLFAWYFAHTIGNKVVELLGRTKLNQAIRRLGWDEAITRVYAGGSMIAIFGKTVEIWILLLFAMVCSGILGLSQLSQIFNRVWEYFINIFIAFLIFAVAVFLADLCRKNLAANLAKEKFAYSHFLAKAVSSTIWTLAVLAILYQLKIIAPLVLAIFIGIVITVSLAVGVALGLGGKDIAAKILKEVEERIKK
jgi:hypothetical protein